jgi:hemolysin activation/secretion protein
MFYVLLADLINEPITFAQLLEAQTIITEYYHKAGYITSGAFIPPQNLNQGTVTIQVIEGAIEDVRITGLTHLKSSYIRRRLRRATRPPLNQEKLLETLQLLQLDPLISTLSVNLSAGTEPGLSILELELKEAKRIRSTFTLDNARSPSVGTVRNRADVIHQNLLGFGDQLAFSFTNTRGSNSLDRLSYTWPFDARDTTLELSYSRSQNSIIEEPFDILDITSRSRSYQLTYRQPVYLTPTTELAFGLTLGMQESQSFLGLDDIGGFPFSPGADGNGLTRVSALRLVGEYSKKSSRDVFAIRSQVNFGVPWFNASQSEIETVPDSQFLSVRSQVQYLRLIAPEVLFLIRADAQWTPDDVLSLEEFAIGGASTVRGYRQDELLADNGFYASAEVRFPILKIPDWDTQLQLASFFDTGMVWNSNSEFEISPNTLSSVGVGLNLSIGRQLQGRLDWGIPLVNLDTEGSTLQENGIYFTLSYGF